MATFTQKIRAAIQAYRGGPARSDYWPTIGREQKAAPFVVWPDYRMETPQWRMIDLGAYIHEGFGANAVIYSAIMYKARAAATPKAVAYTGDPLMPEVLPPNHWLSMIANRPNPSQSWSEYQALQDMFLNLAGESFGFVERRGKQPVAIYPLNPLRIRIIAQKSGKRSLVGFWYTPDGAAEKDGLPLLPQDVIHTKLPNPSDPFDGDGYGFPPLSPAARPTDVDNMITRFLQMFFDKGALPAGILKFEQALDNPVVEGIKARWRDTYGGYEKWTDIGVLDRAGEYQRISQNFDEMAFGDLDNRNEARMTMPFGVPPILIGTRLGLERSTYSNYAEARDAFWQDTMLFEMRLFEDDYRYHLSYNGAWLAFDYSTVPALADDGTQQAELVAAAFRDGAATANQYLQALGLDPVENDYYIMPISHVRIPAGAAETELEPSDESADMEDDDRDDTPKSIEAKAFRVWSDEQKDLHWKAVDSVARSWERKFAEGAADALEIDKRNILALLTEQRKAAKYAKSSIQWEKYFGIVRQYLLGSGMDSGWKDIFLPLIRGIVIAQGERWAKDLGLAFNVQNLEARDWFNAYTLTFAQEINKTTLDNIATILNTAQAEGWSVPTMQNRLEQLFDQYIKGGASGDDFEWYNDRLPPHRTEMIARTETMRASNAGTFEIFDTWGVQRKQWLSTRDDRTRTRAKGDAYEHLASWPEGPNGEIKPMNEAFTGTGQPLRYPHDPIGSAGNVINCRCTILPVLPGEDTAIERP